MPHNAAMDTDRPTRARPPGWLDGATYVAVLVMGGIGLRGMDQPGAQAAAALVCLAYCLLYAVLYRAARVERWHGPYFAAQITLLAGLLLLPTRSYDAFHFLLFVLGMQAVAVLPRRPALLWLALLVVVSALTTVYHRGLVPTTLIPLAFNGAAFLLVGAFSQAWHQTDVARRRSDELLAELREAQGQARDLAVVEERNRLAREVHDSVGHRLTVAVVQLEGAQRLIPTDPERAARVIGAMRDQMKEGLAELRRTVGVLRAPRDAADGLPLAPALTALAQGFQESTGLVVHLALPDPPPALPEAGRLALYRAAQEALTNVQRHASARHVWLTLEATDHDVTLTAGDDGRGWPAVADPTPGVGLRGLRERLRALGGEVGLEERPGGGAQVRVSLPLACPEPVR
jgi:signal transduction histidine kinase